MSKIKEYLQNIREIVTDNQKIWYDYLLEHGESFNVRKDYEKNNLPFVREKQCFNNSFLLTTVIDYDFYYYEGFYLCDGLPFPIEHAFNKKSNEDFIIDITAQKFDIKVNEWFGIKIPNCVLKDWFHGDQHLTPLQYYFRFKIKYKK